MFIKLLSEHRVTQEEELSAAIEDDTEAMSVALLTEGSVYAAMA